MNKYIIGLMMFIILALIGKDIVSTTMDTTTAISAEYNVTDKNNSEPIHFLKRIMIPVIGIIGGSLIVIGLMYLLRTRD